MERHGEFVFCDRYGRSCFPDPYTVSGWEFPKEWFDGGGLTGEVIWCSYCWDAWMYPRRIRLSMPLASGPNLHDKIMTFLYTDAKKLVLRRAAFVVLSGPNDCQFRRLMRAVPYSVDAQDYACRMHVLEYIVMFLF